ncbi:MAG: phenylalanine--tRNA ligase subunit beta [Gemmatimonadaceae bacterium]
MNASYEWLKAFVPGLELAPEKVRDLLTEHAATVEEVVRLRSDLSAIVIARVDKAERHPDSDHLWVTQVDAGGADTLEVICGAPNVTAGKLYPFAQIGTTLPNGIRIERRKIRGIFSNGMLCSAKELGLGDDHQGILELDVDARPGVPFLDVMPIGDTRLVIDVGANRPDLLSHIGVARELAAITGRKMRLPEIPNLGTEVREPKSSKGKGTTAGITVEVESETRTRRYMGAVVRGVKIGPSPDWLAQRLEAVGVRSISNVVDATNYVLHELGQPVHAFDLAKLSGSVVVRPAKAGEKLTTLDGSERVLPKNAVVIADSRAAQAVAGVMGGRESEVTNETKDLFIEVASFDPKLTRATRKALGLSTDASHRFERGVDPELGPVALDRVVRLILSLAGGELADTPADVVAGKAARPEVAVRMKRVEAVLGDPVSLEQSRKYLESIGFEIVSKTEQALTVRVPSWRPDVVEEIDLVEEVARLHGYDKFSDEIRPFRPTTTFDDPQWSTADWLREALVGHGLLEVRPMPFVHGGDETHVRVSNPLAENEAYLRTSVRETLSRRAEFNLAQRNGDIRIFEIGSTFAAQKRALPIEDMELGVLIMGRRRPPHFTEPQPPNIDEWDARALGELAAQAAYPGEPVELIPAEQPAAHLWQIRVGERVVGSVHRVQLDAPVWAAPAFGVSLGLGRVESTPPADRGHHAYKEDGRPARPAVSKYRALPTMPAAEFDLALLVPSGTTAADVERVIRASAGELLERLDLFDQYTGAGVDAGHRSLAWRLTFRHAERTLRDKEIEGRRNKILGALQQELHVRPRST